jgi:hypothetical protein
MQPTQTLLELLVEFYAARKSRRPEGAKPHPIEPLPIEAALEKKSRFPFLP